MHFLVGDAVEQVRAIEQELAKFNPELLERPRWLVMNKADVLDENERHTRAKEIVERLEWKDPWFLISAISREGTWDVCQKVQQFFDAARAAARDAEEASADVRMREG
ncbi:hypothetical protein [Pinirhizobacter soli]|uniref:hypothetical protein n=1 Tax=Pinirhizobacter soli TaxID=2786953 RepID=UPI003CCCB3B0